MEKEGNVTYQKGIQVSQPSQMCVCVCVWVNVRRDVCSQARSVVSKPRDTIEETPCSLSYET